MIFLVKEKLTSSSASPVLQGTSSSASPVFQDTLLLSITYALWLPPQHHLFWPDALLSITYFLGGPPPQHHLFWPDVLLSITYFPGDLLLSITYVLVRVCCDALQPFSKYGRAPIGTFYLSDELYSRQ